MACLRMWGLSTSCIYWLRFWVCASRFSSVLHHPLFCVAVDVFDFEGRVSDEGSWMKLWVFPLSPKRVNSSIYGMCWTLNLCLSSSGCLGTSCWDSFGFFISTSLSWTWPGKIRFFPFWPYENAVNRWCARETFTFNSDHHTGNVSCTA